MDNSRRQARGETLKLYNIFGRGRDSDLHTYKSKEYEYGSEGITRWERESESEATSEGEALDRYIVNDEILATVYVIYLRVTFIQ